MTHAEFHRAVEAFAGRQLCSSKVEVMRQSDGVLVIEYSAYISGRSWTGTYRTPNEVLAELGRPMTTVRDVEGLGAVEAEVSL